MLASEQTRLDILSFQHTANIVLYHLASLKGYELILSCDLGTKTCPFPPYTATRHGKARQRRSYWFGLLQLVRSDDVAVGIAWFSFTTND